MDLKDGIFEARNALALSRASDAERIAEAMRAQRVVGVLGEAEVGKTTTVGQALAALRLPCLAIRLDLGEAAGEDHVGFLLAREVGRAQLGDLGSIMLQEGGLIPPDLERGRVLLADLLGVDGLDEALRAWPSGDYPAARGFDAVERLARENEIVLWIDHVEAPRLTPRHPLDLDRLLWGVRAMVQRTPGMRVVVCCRAGVEDELLGARAPFHQQGRWLTLDAPSARCWKTVAAALGVPLPLAAQLLDNTDGHPGTMMHALIYLAERPGQGLEPEAVLRELALRDDGLLLRAIQHARTLHRLGGQVLAQIAHGERPYAEAQRGSASPQEIRKVLNRLRLAGLLRRRGDAWEVVNPLVAIHLRGEAGWLLDR